MGANRAGYSDDYIDMWAIIRWQGAITSAIRGKRGQAFLREFVAVLDGMPKHELIAEELQSEDGVCGLGAVCAARGISVDGMEMPDDTDILATSLGIAGALARELAYMNDDFYPAIGNSHGARAMRWEIVREWAVSHILNEEAYG